MGSFNKIFYFYPHSFIIYIFSPLLVITNIRGQKKKTSIYCTLLLIFWTKIVMLPLRGESLNGNILFKMCNYIESNKYNCKQKSNSNKI